MAAWTTLLKTFTDMPTNRPSLNVLMHHCSKAPNQQALDDSSDPSSESDNLNNVYEEVCFRVRIMRHLARLKGNLEVDKVQYIHACVCIVCVCVCLSVYMEAFGTAEGASLGG